MPRKKGKSVSFDAMVKFFMHTYNIPTKQDIERINARLDRIERLLVNAETSRGRRSPGGKAVGKQALNTASDMVLEVIQRHEDGIGFGDIQIQTGFGEKKLRNIIFRLHKTGKIRRKTRGIYIDNKPPEDLKS
jgi:hypothetical protein